MRIRTLFLTPLISLTASIAVAQATSQPALPEQQETNTPPPALAAAQETQEDDNLLGQINDDRYVAPAGLFSVKIPILPELGGSISDTQRSVVFQDAFFTHITIVSVALDSTQRFELSTSSKKEFLVKFFRDAVMPSLVRSFPGANWEKGHYLSGVQGGAVMLQTLLPNGSNFRRRTALLGQNDPVTIAKRGNLIFTQGDTLYIVSMELGERSTERSAYTRTVEQDDVILRQRLIDVAGSMRFSSVPATTPAAK